MGGVKRVFVRGEDLPNFLASNQDLCVVELYDGRRVILSGLEILRGQGKGWSKEETAEKVAAFVADPDPFGDNRLHWPL